MSADQQPNPPAAPSALPHIPPQHNITLRTTRLILRPVQPADLPTIHALRRDPTVMAHSTTGVDSELDPLKSTALGRLQMMMAPERLTFAVELAEHDANDRGGNEANNYSASQNEPSRQPAIGFLGIVRPPEMFYNYEVACWGRGYASEALRAFLACYWERFPEGLPGWKDEGWADYLEAGVLEGNRGSERVLEKSGFELNGRHEMEVRGGVKTMASMYRIKRPERDEGQRESL